MTLAYRCSNCGTLLQTTNADPLHDEIDRLRAALETARTLIRFELPITGSDVVKEIEAVLFEHKEPT